MHVPIAFTAVTRCRTSLTHVVVNPGVDGLEPVPESETT